jgi:hypothetical protein
VRRASERESEREIERERERERERVCEIERRRVIEVVPSTELLRACAVEGGPSERTTEGGIDQTLQRSPPATFTPCKSLVYVESESYTFVFN